MAPKKKAVKVASFADGFPDDPDLQMLVRLFEQGRYDAVRTHALRLAQTTPNPKVASAAMVLRSRVGSDPLAVRLLIVTLILLVGLTVWVYLVHGR